MLKLRMNGKSHSDYQQKYVFFQSVTSRNEICSRRSIGDQVPVVKMSFQKPTGNIRYDKNFQSFVENIQNII